MLWLDTLAASEVLLPRCRVHPEIGMVRILFTTQIVEGSHGRPSTHNSHAPHVFNQCLVSHWMLQITTSLPTCRTHPNLNQ